MAKLAKVCVLGAGSWGSALAIVLANNGYDTALWGRDAVAISAIARTRMNERYLPNILFPDNVVAYSDLEVALREAELICLAVPCSAFQQVIHEITPLLVHRPPITWACKGLLPESGQLLISFADAILGEDYPWAILSGPSFAREVAMKQPTAVSMAAREITVARTCQRYFHRENFRVYPNNDPIGVSVGGAMKNVFAIAVGMSDALHYGANTRAALITRGLAEMERLAMHLGAKTTTLMGLAGVGDLILSCTDNQSRNRRLGYAIGEGANVYTAEKMIGQVVEGRHTAKNILTLAKQEAMELPICEQVAAVIAGEVTAAEAAKHLLMRPPQDEGV